MELKTSVTCGVYLSTIRTAGIEAAQTLFKMMRNV